MYLWIFLIVAAIIVVLVVVVDCVLFVNPFATLSVITCCYVQDAT